MVYENNQADDDLVMACFQGNLELVKHYINMGGNPNEARDKRFGNTCLHQAAKGNHLPVCKYLVEEHNVDLSARENLGMTPLILATTYDHVEVLRYLVEGAGAPIDEGTHTNATAAFFACQKGFMASLRYLAERGADINKAINSGATPLLIACEKGQLECVKYLCERRAAVDQPKRNGVTPLWRACEKGYLEIVRYLVERGNANLEAWDPNRRGPIHVACRAGWLEIARVLVRAGADANAQDHGGFTPLCEACGWGKADLVGWLLAHGADPLAAGWNGNTGLHLAAWKGYARVVELMCRRGRVPVDLKNHYGFTPLHLAAQAGRPEALAALLRRRARPELRTCHGDTALHLAVQSAAGALERPERQAAALAAVRALLDAKADPTKKNIYGASCFHLARRAARGAAAAAAAAAHAAAAAAQAQAQAQGGEGAAAAAPPPPPEGVLEALLAAGWRDPAPAGSPGPVGPAHAPVARVVGGRAGRSPGPAAAASPSPGPAAAAAAAAAAAEGGGGGGGAGSPGPGGVLTPAARFATDANQIIPTISLENVLVLRKAIVLHSGEIPSYDKCVREGWHETAAQIGYDDKVLFVSHRWGSAEEADPTNAQWEILRHFLAGPRGHEIAWVWVDDACVCQDKESDEFKTQLSNIPTAVWCATHFLIIPKVVHLAVPRDPEDLCPATDLKDYVSRAWCLLEVFAAMLTATRVCCSFQLGAQVHHEPFDQPQGATSSLGFYQAKVNVWNRLLRERSDDWLKADKNGLSAIRDIVEPCRVLGLLVSIATKGNGEYKYIMEKARTLSVTLEDVESGGDELRELWEGMGKTYIDNDKVIVLNLTLFIGFYSMGKVVVNDDDEEEEEESEGEAGGEGGPAEQYQLGPPEGGGGAAVGEGTGGELAALAAAHDGFSSSPHHWRSARLLEEDGEAEARPPAGAAGGGLGALLASRAAAAAGTGAGAGGDGQLGGGEDCVDATCCLVS